MAACQRPSHSRRILTSILFFTPAFDSADALAEIQHAHFENHKV